ncbi:PREDICTED: butyrophilin subfamily 1 member A1-like [Lipotes vexillifer]|uniref:Butyrophilin subfamily 1 member A1-like n=1 Tax=Lipotes vexillifer TaxID=118797 RepID=A0A340XHU7_LIPVE|nr:PREDICTED: butyrophilin subfamily 1 member A1-like [Lipotes vexillifer]
MTKWAVFGYIQKFWVIAHTRLRAETKHPRQQQIWGLLGSLNLLTLLSLETLQKPQPFKAELWAGPASCPVSPADAMGDLSSCCALCRLTSLLLLIQLPTGGSAECFAEIQNHHSSIPRVMMAHVIQHLSPACPGLPTRLCVFPALTLCLSSFLTPMSVSTEGFFVTGPSDPIVAVLGGDAVLPCRVFPPMSAEDMELRWLHSKFSEAVFIYQNRVEQNEGQMARYVGRTSLVSDFLAQGEAAVRIQNVQVSDNGLYTCFFRMGGFYEEASLELKVAGVGSAPQVCITGPEEDGVRVVCTASGWFPKPQVQWRGLSGEKFLAFSEAHSQDAEGLFSVEVALVVRDSSAGNVTCSVLNTVLGQEKAVAIFIPEPFFPQASPWKLAFSVSLTVLMALLLGAGYYTMREHFRKLRVMREKESLRLVKEQDRWAKEEVLKDTGWRKSAYLAGLTRVCSLSAWRKAQLYADWRKEKFQAWPVTLDPGSAHSNVVVSHENTTVAWKDTKMSSEDTGSILGFESITSGCCYWEVEIRDGDRSEWVLGVCREGVDRNSWYVESPEKGFWVIGQYDTGYRACTVPLTQLSLRQVPHRVGVFLDHEEGDVSFYNMTDGSHIFFFPRASFSGTIFPYFRIRSGAVSLTICSKEGWSEGHPVPHNSSFLEEPVSLPGEGFSSGSGANSPPVAESPLLPCIPEAVSP